MDELTSLALGRRKALPDALRVLVEAYPRPTWEAHDNFGQLVQFWMQRHGMFRQLVDILQGDARHFADRDMDFQAYAPRLSHYAGTLLNELHNHHQIEDHHYFPKLVNLDARVARGFDLLETDHDAMDALINGMAESANAVLQRGDILPFIERLDAFGKLLERHLTDEEEIVVPVILHTGFQG